MKNKKQLLLDVSQLYADVWMERYANKGWNNLPSLKKCPQNILMKDFLVMSEKKLKEEFSYEWEDIFLTNKALQEVGLSLEMTEKRLEELIENEIGRCYDFNLRVRVWKRNDDNINKKKEKNDIKKSVIEIFENKDSNLSLFENEIEVTFL